MNPLGQHFILCGNEIRLFRRFLHLVILLSCLHTCCTWAFVTLFTHATYPPPRYSAFLEPARLRAIEAATSIGLALGPQKFGQDAIALTKLLLELLETLGPDKADIVRHFVLTGFVRLCQTLGEDFAGCFPKLLPQLCKLGQTSAASMAGLRSKQLMFASADEDEDRNTSELQDKVQAVLTLTSILDVFKVSASPKWREFFPMVAETLLSGCSFVHSADVRGYCVVNIPTIVQYAEFAASQQMLSPKDVVDLLNSVAAALSRAIDVENMMDNMCSVAAAITGVGWKAKFGVMATHAVLL